MWMCEGCGVVVRDGGGGKKGMGGLFCGRRVGEGFGGQGGGGARVGNGIGGCGEGGDGEARGVRVGVGLEVWSVRVVTGWGPEISGELDLGVCVEGRENSEVRVELGGGGDAVEVQVGGWVAMSGGGRGWGRDAVDWCQLGDGEGWWVGVRAGGWGPQI